MQYTTHKEVVSTHLGTIAHVCMLESLWDNVCIDLAPVCSNTCVYVVCSVSFSHF